MLAVSGPWTTFLAVDTYVKNRGTTLAHIEQVVGYVDIERTAATWHADRTYVLEKVQQTFRDPSHDPVLSRQCMNVFCRKIVRGALWRAAGLTKDEPHSDK